MIDQINAVQKQSKDTAQKEVRHLAKTVALEQKVEQKVGELKKLHEGHYHNLLPEYPYCLPPPRTFGPKNN